MKLPLHVSESKTAASNINAAHKNPSEKSRPQQAAERRNVSSKRPINHFRHIHSPCVCGELFQIRPGRSEAARTGGQGEGRREGVRGSPESCLHSLRQGGRVTPTVESGGGGHSPGGAGPGLERRCRTPNVRHKPALRRDLENGASGPRHRSQRSPEPCEAPRTRAQGAVLGC